MGARRRPCWLSSSVYETEPVGEVLDQRAFYNACVRVETRLKPEPLLDACKAVERAFGRIQAGETATSSTGRARSTSTCCCSATLSTRPSGSTLPHREVTSRRFVLVPLLELRPTLEVPGRGRAADALRADRGPGRARARPAAGGGAVACCWSSTSATRRRTSAPTTATELVHDWRFATVRESTADELGAALTAPARAARVRLRRHRRLDRVGHRPVAAAAVDGDGPALPRPRDAAGRPGPADRDADPLRQPARDRPGPARQRRRRLRARRAGRA